MHKVDYINKIIEMKPEYKKIRGRLWCCSIEKLQNIFNKLKKEEADAKNNN